MAKPKVSIVVERRETPYALVYLPDRLVPDLKAIEGILCATEMGGCWMIKTDPRYDHEEILREIENLDTPIPPAFME